MSGSGNGGYTPPQRTIFDCETSRINTNLSSVDFELLKKIVIGDFLEVEIGERETLVVINGDGEVVGSIVHVNTVDIIECIKKGSEYKAEVINITFPACRVLIKSI